MMRNPSLMSNSMALVILLMLSLNAQTAAIRNSPAMQDYYQREFPASVRAAR